MCGAVADLAAELLRAAEDVSDPASSRSPARDRPARGRHRHVVVGGLHQLRDPAVGRRGRTRSGSPTPIASISMTLSRRARPN